jgi:glucose-1-phosphate cytidylyltransferase
MYSTHGINDFIICCGYKGYMIKEYFSNYFLHNSDIRVDLNSNSIEILQKFSEPWKITLVDTGENSQTGGRLLRVKKYLEGEKFFCFTYGDGLSDVDISKTIKFHNDHNRLATMTAVQPPGRFGAIEHEHGKVIRFIEKPRGDGGLINGGFFILSPKALDLIENDLISWEGYPLQKLSELGELMVYEHKEFWHAMDTMRDKNYLEELWCSGKAPWKKW